MITLDDLTRSWTVHGHLLDVYYGFLALGLNGVLGVDRSVSVDEYVRKTCLGGVIDPDLMRKVADIDMSIPMVNFGSGEKETDAEFKTRHHNWFLTHLDGVSDSTEEKGVAGVFMEFLDKEGIRDEFVARTESREKGGGSWVSMDDYLRSTKPENYVLGAFLWVNVSDDEKWGRVDDKWNEFLANQEKCGGDGE